LPVLLNGGVICPVLSAYKRAACQALAADYRRVSAFHTVSPLSQIPNAFLRHLFKYVQPNFHDVFPVGASLQDIDFFVKHFIAVNVEVFTQNGVVDLHQQRYNLTLFVFHVITSQALP
jgi:hypothetical protein